MKHILTFTLLFLIGNSLLNAQNFQLKVVSENAPLPYAYVYINGRIFCSADSLGIAIIPVSSLKLGDTLSSSFIGADNNFVIYDNNMAIKGEQTITLKENLSLDGVIVLANDRSEEYFKKYVNKYYVGYYYEYAGDFKYTFNHSWNSPNKTIAGSFSNLIAVSNNKFDIIVNTESDTSGVQKKIKMISYQFIAYALEESFLSKLSSMNKGIIIKYKGEFEGKLVFFITRPYLVGKTNLQSDQILLYVDKNTKNIISVDADLIFNNGAYSCSIKSEYFIDKNNKVIIPGKIEGVMNYSTKDGKCEDKILITNIVARKTKASL